MHKKIGLITLFLLAVVVADAQDIQARLTVITSRISTNIDKKIFNTLADNTDQFYQ